MKANGTGTCCARYHGWAPFNMVERWAVHILGYMKPHLQKVCYLAYEDDHAHTLDKMALVTRNKPRTAKKPLVGGVTPWRGKIDTWKEFFTEDDENYFWMYAEEAMNLLGIKDEAVTQNTNDKAQGRAGGSGLYSPDATGSPEAVREHIPV